MVFLVKYRNAATVGERASFQLVNMNHAHRVTLVINDFSKKNIISNFSNNLKFDQSLTKLEFNYLLENILMIMRCDKPSDVSLDSATTTIKMPRIIPISL